MSSLAVNDSMRTFEHDIIALVSLASRPNKYLDIDQVTGRIDTDWKPKDDGTYPGFCLLIGKPKGAPVTPTIKTTDVDIGGYNPDALISLGVGSKMEFSVAVNILVKKTTAKVDGVKVTYIHSFWHSETPNCMSCYVLQRNAAGVLDGTFANYQIGVTTPDNGQNWFVHAGYRYEGKICSHTGGPVVVPKHPSYGPFVTWMPIFRHPGFAKTLKQAKISAWSGKPQDLDPPLPPVPPGKFARLQWFSEFAGTGLGFGYSDLDSAGRKVAVIDGQSLRTPNWLPKRGDIVSYDDAVLFGTGKNRKLTNVQFVRRPW